MYLRYTNDTKIEVLIRSSDLHVTILYFHKHINVTKLIMCFLYIGLILLFLDSVPCSIQKAVVLVILATYLEKYPDKRIEFYKRTNL